LLSDWAYAYPRDTPVAGVGGTRTALYGCANPDGDALGTWCPIDPEKCDRFAGYVQVNVSTQVAFDYCAAEPPAMQWKDGCRGPRIAEWDQCGGKSNCTEWGCADAVWAGACCAAGLECHRQHAYYHQCLRPNSTSPPPSSPGAASSSGSAPQAASSSTAESAPPALPALEVAHPLLQSKEPGAKIYVNLRVDHSYDLIKDDVGAQAAFKSDVVAWLKAATGAPEYVYSAGELASVAAEWGAGGSPWVLPVRKEPSGAVRSAVRYGCA
jgi:hypothetical protein